MLLGMQAVSFLHAFCQQVPQTGSAEDALLGRSAFVQVNRATKWHVEAELI